MVCMNMNSKPHVVLGEARESDSEEEIDSSTVSTEQIDICKGKIVFGEAPESDEETCAHSGSLESVSSAVSALSLPPQNVKKKSSKTHRSILVKKLYERNSSLHKNLNDFINQTATNAGNELNAANQRLLKSQLQMQEGTDFLRVINSNLTVLQNNLESLLSIEHLPVINIEGNNMQTKPP